MYTLKVENQSGEILDFTNNTNYDVLKIDGLTPPSATLNFSEMANYDGSTYNSAQLGNRNVVLTIKIHNDAETNRINLYNFFKVKKKVRLYYANGLRDVYIDGYVETFEGDLFTINEQMQISIICPNPYWKENKFTSIEFSNVVDLFEFPFAIEEEGIEFSRLEQIATEYINAGEVEIGAIIEFHALANQVLNPKIYNRTTQTFFGINFDMVEGDTIRINTIRGEKSVVLFRDGAETNIINKLTQGSTWIQLIPGNNEISYECDEGAENVVVTVTASKCFEGV